MKPWRPYLKRIEHLMDVLLRGAEPRPFSGNGEIAGWIDKLPFVEIVLCNDLCDSLAATLKHGDISEKYQPYQPLFGGANIRWQAILRCGCALDFCAGRIEKRKDFDWNQDPEIIYRYLLVELWGRSALHWSRKAFSPPMNAGAAHAHSQLSNQFWRIDPTRN